MTQGKQPCNGKGVRSAFLRKIGCGRGQSTVEAAFFIPVLLGCVLLLVQPGILLYDRMVMYNAAAEGCRVLATSADSSSSSICAQYVKRRLGAIPQQDCFHVHSSGCSYSVSLEGSRSSSQVAVEVSTKVKPLPLIDFAAKSLRLTDADGLLTVKVKVEESTQPAWVRASSAGSDPASWVGAWLS